MAKQSLASGNFRNEYNDDEERRQSSICDFSKPSVRWGWGIFSFSAILVSIILICVSLKKLSSTEYGVAYDRWEKVLINATKTGGLHAGPPGYRFIKFPSTQITTDLQDICVSRDGLRVAFDVTFQYQMPADRIVDAVEEFRDFKTWSKVVEAAGNSAVQHTCSEFNVTDFQGMRGIIQDSMLENIRVKLQGSSTKITSDGVYALASSLQLRNVELPGEYKNAIASKQRAEEDILLATNQRKQEITRASTELKAAQQEQTKILNTAYNTGNVTILESNLKAEETLFAFEKEQQVLMEARARFGLSSNGILAYMSNQLYASMDKLAVSTEEPARISRKGLLSEASIPADGRI
mmetsp:Transcript_3977/g.5837  ORF Transcript_3977/g.5837 Transcript_3977/m.5837 type:complete len:351 (-) Transcript_3977:247-1299(-)